MSMVDRGDQGRANYPIQRDQVKSWKAIFCNLVNIIAVNAYWLSLHSGAAKDQKFTDHGIASSEKLCTWPVQLLNQGE